MNTNTGVAGGSCALNGHSWRDKTDSHGKLVRVCDMCGTDELGVAVDRLRTLAAVIRENGPIGHWPNVRTADAIDTVLAVLTGASA